MCYFTNGRIAKPSRVFSQLYSNVVICIWSNYCKIQHDILISCRLNWTSEMMVIIPHIQLEGKYVHTKTEFFHSKYAPHNSKYSPISATKKVVTGILALQTRS